MKRSILFLLTASLAMTGTVLASPLRSADPAPTISPSPSPTSSVSASPSNTPPVSGTTSIRLSPSSRDIRFGKTLSLDGELDVEGCEGPFKIKVTQKVLGSKWSETLTDEIEMIGPGSFTFSFPADHSAVYTAVVAPRSDCSGSSTRTKEVTVRAQIRSDGIDGCPLSPRVSGKVLPKYPDTKVVLKDTKGKTVDRDRLNRSSGFKLKPGSCGGRYIIEWRSQSEANSAGMKVVS